MFFQSLFSGSNVSQKIIGSFTLVAIQTIYKTFFALRSPRNFWRLWEKCLSSVLRAVSHKLYGIFLCLPNASANSRNFYILSPRSNRINTFLGLVCVMYLIFNRDTQTYTGFRDFSIRNALPRTQPQKLQNSEKCSLFFFFFFKIEVHLAYKLIQRHARLIKQIGASACSSSISRLELFVDRAIDIGLHEIAFLKDRQCYVSHDVSTKEGIPVNDSRNLCSLEWFFVWKVNLSITDISLRESFVEMQYKNVYIFFSHVLFFYTM